MKERSQDLSFIFSSVNISTMSTYKMKSFSTYLAESADREYTKFLSDMSAVQYVTDRTSLYIDEVDDLIYAGKPIGKFFAKMDKHVANMVAFAKKDHAGRWQIECKQALKMADRYEMIKGRYMMYSKNLMDVLSCISKGDSQEEAVKKLVAFAKKHKYYNMETGKFSGPFFDDVNEKDILRQIDTYKGMVKLNGGVNFNIIFANGKVKNFYF